MCKKKIGIITQPLHSNYGGLLQNYALQQALKSMGHEAITIDQLNVKPPLWTSYASYIKTFLLKLIRKDSRRIYPHIRKRLDEQTNRNMTYFVEKYINHTSKVANYHSIRKLAKKLSLDTYIVGSDQVWRPCYNVRIYNAFLDFTHSWKVKRIAYAASFGNDFWEFSFWQTRKCKKLIKQFDALSVRENSGIKLCRDYLDVHAIQVLDPTMLLQAKDYIQLVKKEKEIPVSGELLVYILDSSPFKLNIISKTATQLNLLPFSVMRNNELKSETIEDRELWTLPTVTKWLRGFVDAKFVVCDSFHGVVFSIIFNKPFIVLGNKERGMARFNSLLQIFDLKERLVSTEDDLAIIGKTIDWEKVNRKYMEWNKISHDFLTSSLC